VSDVVVNLSDIISVLPPEIIEKIGGLIVVLQAVSIAFIVYVVYLIISFVLNIKRYKKLGVLEGKIDLIGGKVDKLLKRKFKK